MSKTMEKNNKLDELTEALLKWAEEDGTNRSVMLIAGDEDSVRNVYQGSKRNLVESLTNAMLRDKELRSVCASAFFMYEKNRANDNDEE